jgi:hypothetical protein
MHDVYLRLRLHPFCHVICQDLWLYCAAPFKVDNILWELCCPFSNSSGAIPVAKDVMQWLVCQDSYGVSLEIMPELPWTQNYRITNLLDFRIILFGPSWDLQYKIYWVLLFWHSSPCAHAQPLIKQPYPPHVAHHAVWFSPSSSGMNQSQDEVLSPLSPK